MKSEAPISNSSNAPYQPGASLFSDTSFPLLQSEDGETERGIRGNTWYAQRHDWYTGH